MIKKNYIIISLYNRLFLTKKTLEHLFDFSGEYFDLFLVDDGSTDGTKDYLKTLKPSGFCKNIEIKIYEESKGKAKRLNEFLSTRDYAFCAVVDNDVLLPLNWLKDGINILTKHDFVGMVGVNVEGINGNVTLQPIQNVSNFFSTNCIGGACLLWGEFFKNKIKTFCEDYGRYGHEDAHATNQVRQLGKIVACLPDFGMHLGDNNFLKEKDEWHKQYITWKLDTFKEGINKLLRNIRQ